MQMHNHLGGVWKFLQKLKSHLHEDLAILLLVICPKEKKYASVTDLYINVPGIFSVTAPTGNNILLAKKVRGSDSHNFWCSTNYNSYKNYKFHQTYNYPTHQAVYV